MLSCTDIHYITLRYIALHCITLKDITSHYTHIYIYIIHDITPHCIYCIGVHHITLDDIIWHYIMCSIHIIYTLAYKGVNMNIYDHIWYIYRVYTYNHIGYRCILYFKRQQKTSRTQTRHLTMVWPMRPCKCPGVGWGFHARASEIFRD